MNSGAPDPLQGYDRIARRYAGDEIEEDDPALRAACRALFQAALPGPRVLEFGCGPATDSGFFARDHLEVTASDGSEVFLQVVRERYPQIGVERWDFREPPPFTTRFHGIWGFACLLHLQRPDVPASLRRLHALLEPDGVLFTTMIESTKLDEYTIENWGGEEGGSMHFSCFSADAFVKLLRDAGFNEVEVHRVPSPLYETLPRLVERGVSGYQVLATR